MAIWLASVGDGPRTEAVHLKGEELHGTVVAGLGSRLCVYGGIASLWSAGDQAGSCGALFDGVLYNHAELSLRLAGSPTAGMSNADLVLKAYRFWGRDFLRHLKGIFALIIWDGVLDVLLLARDAIGFYPLFYAETEHEILLSTSIHALISHPDVADAVSLPVVANYLRHVNPGIEETFFSKVKRVPPGHFMRISRGSRQMNRYWDPFPSGAGIDWVGEDEVARFDSLMDQAVMRCLDLGPAGIFLSGGLDSVTVAAVLARNSRSRGLPDPHALSLIFPHPECDESDLQTAIARSLGLHHTLLPLDEAAGPRGFLPAALEMTSTWPAPLQSIWNPAYHRLALEGKQQGCRVILTGGGGDEWLTVDPLYAADLLRDMNFPGLFRLLDSFRRSYRLPPMALLHNVLWTNGAKPLIAELWAESALREPLRALAWKHAPGLMQMRRKRQDRMKQASMPEWLMPSAAVRQEAERHAEGNTKRELRAAREEGGFYLRMARQFLEHPLLTMEFEEHFETCRRIGIPILMPFWDQDLIELLYRIPPDLLNRGGRSKGLVREMLARRFPDLGFERQKKVLSLNFFSLRILKEGLAAWEAVGGAQVLAGLDIVDAKLLASTMLKATAGKEMLDAQWIWDILNLEMWLRGKV